MQNLPAMDQEPNQANQQSTLLQLYEGRPGYSERIDKLVSSRWYVYADAPVLELAELLKRENINCVGVVNREKKVLGIVLRQSLLNMMSRQFGREVLKTEKIESILSTCRHFHCDANIFSTADLISHEMQLEEITYFIVKNSENRFMGVFSTNDMLIYLSTIIRQDIELARVIQKGIVREYQNYKNDSVEIVCSSIMSQVVGGDFYSVEEVSADKLFLVLCDVSGKGVAASLVTAFIYGMIHNFKFYTGLGEFVSELNRMFIRTFNLEKFVTGQFILMNPQTGELRACEMGHPFAYVYRDRQLTQIFGESENLPNGVTMELSVQEVFFKMIPGDIVLIVTDGITEQTDNHGNLFPFDSLAGEISRYGDLALNSIAVRILESFHRFRKRAPLHDDVTFLLMRYNG